MIDLGIAVVRVAAEHDAFGSRLLKQLQRRFALSADIAASPLSFLQPRVNRRLQFLCRNARKRGLQCFFQSRHMIDVQEWTYQRNALLPQPVHIGPDDLGIRGDDRTVEMIVG
ncbi:hypothetical protein D3C81_950970 [compost metagenome]